MGLGLFAFGDLLCISGLIVHFVELRYCLRVVRKTTGRADALSFTETWLNTRHFIKRRKLQSLACASDDEELKHFAALALRLGSIFPVLFGSGMLVMLAGASLKP